MKTFNSEEINNYTIDDLLKNLDRQPCWYAELENLRWKVGVKTNTKNDEFSFDLTTIKNYNQLEVRSDKFAIKLIAMYKNGGKKLVKKWIDNGCIS